MTRRQLNLAYARLAAAQRDLDSALVAIVADVMTSSTSAADRLYIARNILATGIAKDVLARDLAGIASTSNAHDARWYNQAVAALSAYVVATQGAL